MSNNSSSSMAPPSPESSALETVETKISPSILFVVTVLAVVFFVCGLLHLLVRHLLRLHRRRRRRMAEQQLGDGGESATAFQGQLQQLFHLHDAGVDQAFIDALPVFLYKNVVGGGGAGKDAFDCAVCLCEFAAEDELRLLPSCSHAFHVDCIDTWLLSHSTCPLCRSSLLLLAELSPPARGGPVVVMVLESDSASEESSPEMADVATRAANGEPSGVPGAGEEVVEVKLGKFMCVEGNAIAASAGDGAGAAAGSSSNGEAGLGLGQRRCHSMGSSYEYVMEEHASLRVSITKPPPKKTKHPAAVSRARGAMSECELGASLRLPPLTTSTTSTQKQHPPPAPAMAAAGSKLLAKDSFSVSKIWMARKDAAGPGERRTVSFRWPVKEDEDQGRRKSGSEAAEWGGDDVESCGGNSAVSAAASLAGEQRPSFARRTLLWVVGAGGRPQTSNRVGSCS